MLGSPRGLLFLNSQCGCRFYTMTRNIPVQRIITPFLGVPVRTSRSVGNNGLLLRAHRIQGITTAAALPNQFLSIPSDKRKKNSIVVHPLQYKNRKFTDENTKHINKDSKEANDTIHLSSRTTSHAQNDPNTRRRRNRLKSSIEDLYRRGAADVFATLGFVSSSTTNLLSDRTQFERLQPIIQAFREYLEISEIDMEISEAVSIRLLGNVLALREIQQQLSPEDRRDEAVKQGRSENSPTQEEFFRFMKYATAAYGNNMIRSVQIGIDGRFDSRVTSRTRRLISDHVGVPEKDIVALDLDHDTEGYHLRHFIAIDHVNKQVVLAIRGTFSFAEIVLDVAAQSRPFCGGEAHGEMANMAERVWEAARGTVMDLLRSNENYELVLTGHSLGAGTACLLHILCHQEERQLVEGRNVRCFAYASPPVFYPLERVVPQAALESCTAYIYDRDAVPFLSVDSVRHLLASLSAIGTERSRLSQLMNWLTRRRSPDADLLQLVKEMNSQRLPPKAGAPPLQIPASAVLWLRRTSDSRDDGISYNAKACDPAKLSQMSILIHANMLGDHAPSRYERALHFLK